MPEQSTTKRARVICYYLPQYHPIPENDVWWGKGFTEWTNVVKALPLFRGHDQPHLPADLGFYDLRLPEARAAQAELALANGIEAFCYWHYWFAGRRILERPMQEILALGEPRLPFCLGWANETWSGVWHGCPDRILLEQTYPGVNDEEAHFYAVLDAFCDDRYLKVDGKPLFYVYKPTQIPEPRRFVEHWQRLALKAGLKGIYFVGEDRHWNWNPMNDGFDAKVPNSPGIALDRLRSRRQSLADKLWRKLNRCSKDLTVFKFSEFMNANRVELPGEYDAYPTVLPGWDNTPRSGNNGLVLIDTTPELFRLQLRQAIQQVEDRPSEKRIIFLKSWNEWAEGNYMEPDMEYGSAFLEACRQEVFR